MARGIVGPPPALAAPVVLLVTASLAWRRRRPLAVAVIVPTGTLGLLLAGLEMDNLGMFVSTLLAEDPTPAQP